MRIWHQSFTVLDDLPAYRDALQAHMREVARPGTEVVLHGMRPGTYTTNYPGSDIRHAWAQYVHGLQFLEAALAAEDQKFDACIFATLPEPALLEARSSVQIPVVGYCEAAIHAAAFLGARVGVLIFIEEMIPLIARNAARHSANVVAVEHVGFKFADVLAGYSDFAPIEEKLTAAVRRLIASHRVDVVIPGEAPLNVLLARHGVNRIDGVPLIDALATALTTAETLAVLREKRGITRTDRGYDFDSPPRARIDELRRFYGFAGP